MSRVKVIYDDRQFYTITEPRKMNFSQATTFNAVGLAMDKDNQTWNAGCTKSNHISRAKKPLRFRMTNSSWGGGRIVRWPLEPTVIFYDGL